MHGTSSQWEAPAAANEGGDSWGFQHSTSAYQLGDISSTDVPTPAPIDAFGASGIVRGGSKRGLSGAAWKPSEGAVLEVKSPMHHLALRQMQCQITTQHDVCNNMYNTRPVAHVAGIASQHELLFFCC